MKNSQIEKLRQSSRKLIRELGILQLDQNDSGQAPEHWHALIEINREPGITISKLGNLLLMSASKISRLITTLKKDRLIQLKTGADKREKYLHITKVGKDLIKKIDEFSISKIKGAFQFLNEKEMGDIIRAINKYSQSLEKSRLMQQQIKIVTLSTSRIVRKQIIKMICDIQKNEFAIPIDNQTNIGILKAEQDYYFNNSYNFWYALDGGGKIVGSIGLKKIDAKKAEIKKFFVIKKYRGQGIAQKLIHTLLKAAAKHGFEELFLGTVDKLKAAQKFYKNCGFALIRPGALPKNFVICPLDSVFFRGKVEDLILNSKVKIF